MTFEQGIMEQPKRMILLDALMMLWGLSTWLGVNGMYVQLPLLVQQLPEGWALPSSMTVAVAAANVTLFVYAALRRLFPRAGDSSYILGLNVLLTLALLVNAFVYSETVTVGGKEYSVAFLAMVFCVAVVGCTSSVVFYPYLRHFRDVYLATYLVGEGLSGFLPSILALIQGASGAPECIPSPDNSGIEARYPPPLFDTMVFMLILSGLAIMSAISFLYIDKSDKFSTEKISAIIEKQECAELQRLEPEPVSDWREGRWLTLAVLVVFLNAVANGVLPSIQSYSCMPYGNTVYHLAVTLSTMANPAACLAGVWLRLAPGRLLAAMLVFAGLPFGYIFSTALMSPTPPLLDLGIGEALVVLSWVSVTAIVSYSRMWTLGHGRRGGGGVMRALGYFGQLGSVAGSLAMFSVVNFTDTFIQPPVCPTPYYQQPIIISRPICGFVAGAWTMDIQFIVAFFASKQLSLLTAILCWDPEQVNRLVQEANQLGLRVASYSPRAAPPLPAYAPHREGALLDLRCDGARNVLIAASSSRAFVHRYTWLLLHTSAERAVLNSTLEGVSILPDADVTWAAHALLDVYRVKVGQPLLITSLGLTMSSSSQELAALWARLPAAATRRKNLHNVGVNAVTVVTQPQSFLGWEDMTMRHVDTFPKLTYPLLQLCAEDLNFTLQIVKQTSLYGEEVNGSFSGLAGLLQRGRAELGICSMFLRADRRRVIHYCSETVQLKGAFIFRQPAQSAVSNVFLLPFSRGVWLAVGGVFVCAGALLLAMTRVVADPVWHFTAFDAATFAVASICQQGFHMTPAALSARVVMFSTVLAALFMFTSYSAKIVAILQTPSDALQTIHDLARSPMGLGVQETTYKRVYFAESTEAVTQQLYRRKLLPLGDKAYMSVEEGIARVRTGLFAFQVEQQAGYDIISKTFTEREKCGLKEIQAFKLPLVAVPLRRNSGYRDLLASRLRWQREVGMMVRERRRWLAEQPRCIGAGAGFLSVGLGDVLPALQDLDRQVCLHTYSRCDTVSFLSALEALATNPTATEEFKHPKERNEAEQSLP